MAKQTIVLIVKIYNNDRLRVKAMQIAGGTNGVRGVEFEYDQDSLTVEGEDVDVFELVQTLIKKVAKTEIYSVSTVTPAAPA